jgi:hypothetical protein
MISEKARAITSPQKIATDLRKGRRGEDLFYKLFPALQKASKQDNFNHSDFNWDEFNVDVKGLKESHKNGYILVEFINVAGKKGWCHKDSKADFIAFQFPEGFIIVAKDDLFGLVKELLPPWQLPVRRKSHSNHEELLYKYCGRYGRQDVFTFIRRDDLNKIPSLFYPT